MMQRAKTCKTFIHPVFKLAGTDNAYLVLLSQFQPPNYFLFTFLEEYRQNPATAQPWMSVAVYLDLLESKKIGLIRADFMPSISKAEAKVLVDMLVASYTVAPMGGSYEKYLEAFNLNPDDFNFDDYIFETRETFRHRFLEENHEAQLQRLVQDVDKNQKQLEKLENK